MVFGATRRFIMYTKHLVPFLVVFIWKIYFGDDSIGRIGGL